MQYNIIYEYDSGKKLELRPFYRRKIAWKDLVVSLDKYNKI